MNFLKNNKNKLSFVLVSALLILIPLYLYSCSGDNYKTAEDLDPMINVLISPWTLNDWLTNGCPEDEYGMNKVVVLHVGDEASYSAGHVPGALRLDTGTDIFSERNDGVSDTIQMVAGKAQMDTVIQRTGIDGGTIVVLTAPNSSNFTLLSRAYFNFRYWGFPRNRIRVLDGFLDTTWTDSGYSLQSTAPAAVEASEYSVCDLTPDPDRFRAPLEEMINIAKDDDPKTVVIDTRTENEFNGVPAQTLGSGGSRYVAFEGRIRTAVWQEYDTELLDTDSKLLPKATLESKFANLTLPVDSTTTAYPYCRTAFRAAITFLALDGVLNYPVKLYDGSWIEWGQMTNRDFLQSSSPYSWLNNLDINSIWKTDAKFDQSYPWMTTIDNNNANNTDGVYSEIEINGGDWVTYTNSRAYDDIAIDSNSRESRRNNTPGDGDSAIWTPQLPSAGNYDVYIWFPYIWSAASDAPFTINHNGQSDTVDVDQNSGGSNYGGWYSLGTYYFSNNGTENVTLTDDADDDVLADAVRFILVEESLSEAVTYNTSVESLTTNSFAPHADEVNVTDAACADSGGGGGGGGY